MKIDRKQVSTEINATSKELVEVKGIFRESHQPRLNWQHFRQLSSLKKKATLLCSIQAHSRGRIHLKGLTLEEQEALIGDAWRVYESQQAA